MFIYTFINIAIYCYIRGIFHKYLLGLTWLAILSREKYVIWPRLALLALRLKEVSLSKPQFLFQERLL